MTTHVSVDLETLGTGPSSVILSIGAIEFDPHSDRTGTRFYTAVDPESCTKAGLTMDASTVMWWLQQSDAARNHVCAAGLNIADALLGLSSFLYDQHGNMDDLRLWCKGPAADAVWLEQAYKACGMLVPFTYRAPRDVRTIVEAAGLNEADVPKPLCFVAHSALWDAMYQAQVIQAAYTKLRPAPGIIDRYVATHDKPHNFYGCV
jgi:hypothetical protein